MSSGQDWGGDFAAYLLQAESLRSGASEGFLEANRAMRLHSDPPLGPDAYPWGYPLLLAAHAELFGDDLLTLKLLGLGFFGAFLLLVGFGFRHRHGLFALLGLLAFLGTSPWILRFSDRLLSDLPFLFFATAGLLLVDRGGGSRGRGALAGLAIGAAALVRSNGVLVFGAALFPWLRAALTRSGDPRPKVGFLIAMAAVFATVTLAGALVFPGGGSGHAAFLAEVNLGRILDNLQYYATLPRKFLIGVPARGLVYGLSRPLLLIGIRRRHRRESAALAFMALTLGVHLVWPFQQGLRFLLPLVPFTLSFALTGLEEMVHRARRRSAWLGRAALGPAVFVLVVSAFTGLRFASRNLRADRRLEGGSTSAEAQELFAFVRRQQGVGTVVFFKPRVMRWATGRRSINHPRPANLKAGDLIVVHRDDRHRESMGRDAAEALVAAGSARRVLETERARVYELVRDLGSTPR